MKVLTELADVVVNDAPEETGPTRFHNPLPVLRHVHGGTAVGGRRGRLTLGPVDELGFSS